MHFLFDTLRLNIAQYNRGGKKSPVQRKACRKGKKKTHHHTPPGQNTHHATVDKILTAHSFNSQRSIQYKAMPPPPKRQPLKIRAPDLTKKKENIPYPNKKSSLLKSPVQVHCWTYLHFSSILHHNRPTSLGHKSSTLARVLLLIGQRYDEGQESPVRAAEHSRG